MRVLNTNTKAIILAAGEGKRLQPLTNTKPKPLLKVLGKSVLFRTMHDLYEAGIREFILITHHMEEMIRDHVSSFNFPGTVISFVHQEKLLGTADAFLLARQYLSDEEFFIGLNGDCIYSPTVLKQAVKAVRKRRITLGGKLVTDTHHYGIIELDDEYPISIIEKPPEGQIKEGYANVGVYVLPTEIFGILDEMKNNKELSDRGELELPHAINKLIKSSDFMTELIKLEGDNYWFDIGLPWSLLEANRELLKLEKGEIRGQVEDNVHIEGTVVIKEGARVRSGAYLEGPIFIDENADIGPNCYIRKYTYLGRNTRIGNACEVKNSIIYDNTHAGHLSYIGDSVIGERVNFGAGTITANLRLDDKEIKVNIKDKRINSKRRKLGAIIGDGVKTGIGVLFMPGVKIGNDSWIGAGTVVNKDVEPETIYYVKQKINIKGKKPDAN